MYGGRGVNNVSDSLYVLDINNWEWGIPKISGTFPTVVTHSHRANIMDKYMIVTFGNYR